MENLTKAIIAVALFSAVNAAGAAEVIVNGGFETGQLAPWATDNFKIETGYSHTGTYYALVQGDINQNQISGYLREDLAVTVSPEEVLSFGLWAFDSLYRDGLDNDVTVYAGDNTPYYVAMIGWQWEYIEFPLSLIQKPFDYIRIDVSADEIGLPPHYLNMAVDDVSLLITPTAGAPSSLGRVKGLFK